MNTEKEKTLIAFTDHNGMCFNMVGAMPDESEHPSIGIIQFAVKGGTPAAGVFARQLPKRIEESFRYFTGISPFSYLFTGNTNEGEARYFIFDNEFSIPHFSDFAKAYKLDYILTGSINIDNGFEMEIKLFHKAENRIVYEKNYQTKNHEDIILLLDGILKDIAGNIGLKTGNFNYFEGLTENPMAFLFYCEAMSKLDTRYLGIPYDPFDTATSLLKTLRFDKFFDEASKKLLAICLEMAEIGKPEIGLELINTYLQIDPKNLLSKDVQTSLEKKINKKNPG
ncbi:MAG: hypothetical protein JW728_03295 [Candidatus Aureabacteria bacterium]|nr:hypothetical protein [Candidatus Auribacterota bacterium]